MISTSVGIVETKIQKLDSALQAASEMWAKGSSGQMGGGGMGRGLQIMLNLGKSKRKIKCISQVAVVSCCL